MSNVTTPAAGSENLQDFATVGKWTASQSDQKVPDI